MSIRSFISSKYSALGLSERTGSVVKNVGLGFVGKGLSILISFIQIPLILSILDKTEYGIWITIFSVTGWLSFFDIGMGNGFKNQLTEALAVNDTDRAKKLVSTIYISMFAIFTCIIILFIIASSYVPWVDIFNTPKRLETQLYYTIVISVIAAAINFVASLVHIILAAKHKTGNSGMLFLVGQMLTLGFILYYKNHQTEYSFLILSTVLSVIPLIVNVAINIYLFFFNYRSISPSVRHYRKDYLKGLMNLGILFFLIQISALIMYATDTFLINKLYGPESVTLYSIAYKYFSVIIIVFTIITTPIWTMYVDAFANKDFVWIKSNIRRLVQFVKLSFIVLIIMNLVAPFVFHTWIGKTFNPTTSLNLLLSLYMLVFIWGSIWVLPLNAAGIIKVQCIISIGQAIFNIPIILLTNIFLNNINAVIMGNIFCIIVGSGIMYIYYRRKFSNLLHSVSKV